MAPQSPYSEVQEQLQLMGLEPGWGKTVERALNTVNLALNLLEAPDSVTLSEFLSRTPNMFNVVILSPHGYFGQKDVLGKPDTGGQVFISLLLFSLFPCCLHLSVLLQEDLPLHSQYNICSASFVPKTFLHIC